jgi:hypothetical protein
MGGRDRTGLVAMLLLAAANVVRDEIVDDYLETVRLGDVRAASANRENAEPRIEEFCATHGTTTAGAFRDALAGLDLHAFFTAAELDVDTIALLLTWRGTLPQQPSR